VASRPKFWPRSRSRPQSFGLGLGLGLKHLASAWPRSAAEEHAAKKRSDRRTNLFVLYFADYRTSQSHYTPNRRWLLCESEWEIKLCRFDHNDTRNTLDCDQSNVYSSRTVFSAISQALFHSSSLCRRSAGDTPSWNKFRISIIID